MDRGRGFANTSINGITAFLRRGRERTGSRLVMDRRNIMLICSLLLYIISQVWSQLCGGPCLCPRTAPRCPPGVGLVLDGCRCCRVCARQEGEACSERNVCDRQRALQCDYSTSFPGGPGQCVRQDSLGCDVNGVRLGEGQTFQPSCAQLCHCLGGGLTCVPLCTDDLQTPPARCPNPQLVRLPGSCCKTWVCDRLDNSIYPHTLTVERAERSGPPPGLRSNSVDQMTAWRPWSLSCGPGVSTRTWSSNRACRPLPLNPLCQIRPRQAASAPHGLQTDAGMREDSYRSSLPVGLELQGCRSVRVYRPRFCGLSCPDGRCCSPYRTRTARPALRCPHGRLMIQSCSCHHYNCPHSLLPPPPRRGLPWS